MLSKLNYVKSIERKKSPIGIYYLTGNQVRHLQSSFTNWEQYEEWEEVFYKSCLI